MNTNHNPSKASTHPPSRSNANEGETPKKEEQHSAGTDPKQEVVTTPKVREVPDRPSREVPDHDRERAAKDRAEGEGMVPHPDQDPANRPYAQGGDKDPHARKIRDERDAPKGNTEGKTKGHTHGKTVTEDPGSNDAPGKKPMRDAPPPKEGTTVAGTEAHKKESGNKPRGTHPRTH